MRICILLDLMVLCPQHINMSAGERSSVGYRHREALETWHRVPRGETHQGGNEALF
jgi:hypothetical protein